MKFIVLLMIFTSILFSWQKQIILGSYSVESNGKRALSTIDKQIKNDILLQSFMEEHSLRTMNTVISGYTVVSINAFDSYTALLNTMNVLKRYYGDAFVLKYPTKNISMAENMEDIEKKAKVEQAIEDTEDEEKRAELKKLLEMDSSINDTTPEVQVEEKRAEFKQEVFEDEVIEEATPVQTKVIVKEGIQIEDYMPYLIALALLALIAIGITVYKIVSVTKTKK